MVSKDIAIDQLTTTNKTLSARQDEYEKTIARLREELMSSKEKISDLKFRQAYLMQSLFELGDKEGLEEATRFLTV
jgi:cell division protein FtsB